MNKRIKLAIIKSKYRHKLIFNQEVKEFRHVYKQLSQEIFEHKDKTKFLISFTATIDGKDYEIGVDFKVKELKELENSTSFFDGLKENLHGHLIQNGISHDITS